MILFTSDQVPTDFHEKTEFMHGICVLLSVSQYLTISHFYVNIYLTKTSGLRKLVQYFASNWSSKVLSMKTCVMRSTSQKTLAVKLDT